MSDSSLADLGAFSMMELLRQEVEAQAAILTEGVLAAERGDLAERERRAFLVD